MSAREPVSDEAAEVHAALSRLRDLLAMLLGEAAPAPSHLSRMLQLQRDVRGAMLADEGHPSFPHAREQAAQSLAQAHAVMASHFQSLAAA